MMNPTVNQSIIDEATERDPASAAAEYGAQFRSDIESFVSREAVEACITSGVRERPPLPKIRLTISAGPGVKFVIRSFQRGTVIFVLSRDDMAKI